MIGGPDGRGLGVGVGVGVRAGAGVTRGRGVGVGAAVGRGVGARVARGDSVGVASGAGVGAGVAADVASDSDASALTPPTPSAEAEGWRVTAGVAGGAVTGAADGLARSVDVAPAEPDEPGVTRLVTGAGFGDPNCCATRRTAATPTSA